MPKKREGKREKESIFHIKYIAFPIILEGREKVGGV